MTPVGRPLHVAHAVLNLDVGGLERIVLDLVRLGVRRGHRASVVCVERPGALAAEAAAHGATVVSLDKPPGRSREATDRCHRVLADLRPDVLHSHQVGALWYCGPAAGRAGVPVVHTEHIDNTAKASGAWRKLKARVLWHTASRHAGLFCCVSDDVAASVTWCRTVPRRKVAVVLNGIDTDPPPPESRAAVRGRLDIPANARVVGTVGRLNEVKQQHLLLTAVADLGVGFADVQVVLVGDGPERGRLEAHAAALGLADRTRFAGYRPDPEAYLAAMDVFVLTSRLEGLPLALLEAWAAGVPVVSTAVGGVPKVVTPGKTGLLIDPGDTVMLTAALRTLLTDPALAGRLAAAGREAVVARYSLTRMADEYEAHYQRLLAAGRGGG